MTDRIKKYLSDIILAIKLVEDFTIETTDFHQYEKDLKTQSAVERQLAIIGEALNKIRALDSNISIQNDKQIIGFRNRLVHAYDSLDNAIIWAVIKKHLPLLKSEIENLNLD